MRWRWRGLPRGEPRPATEYAKRWEKDTPEVALCSRRRWRPRSTSDSDWAAPLVVYRNMAASLSNFLRPATIIGNIPGMRHVPFNVTHAEPDAGRRR